ncbi:hypothetical protein [Burkholderia gladioli]|uniref:hypothetical protein n=1 Tax=Burkholderia gladioli TaxID=28095 RepID=UPI00163F0F35|nr:hypothetical protein [Burkholderia gladioli]
MLPGYIRQIQNITKYLLSQSMRIDMDRESFLAFSRSPATNVALYRFDRTHLLTRSSVSERADLPVPEASLKAYGAVEVKWGNLERLR